MGSSNDSAKIAALEKRVEALEKAVLGAASHPAKTFTFQNSEGYSVTGWTQRHSDGWKAWVEGFGTVEASSEAGAMSRLLMEHEGSLG